jgi:hypothetical protein
LVSFVENATVARPPSPTAAAGKLPASRQQAKRTRFITKLAPLLHHEPPALLVAEIKLRHGGGFGRPLIRGLDGPEVLPALPDDRDARRGHAGKIMATDVKGESASVKPQKPAARALGVGRCYPSLDGARKTRQRAP